MTQIESTMNLLLLSFILSEAKNPSLGAERVW